MNNITARLTQWAIHKIKNEYPDDVALLVAVEGHSVNNDGHGECFDYFIPATDRGYELSRTFILEGIGHDLYPRSWERTERTADLEDRATLCLGNARVLYSRTPEDAQRFEGLRKRLYDNLKSNDFVYKKTLGKIDEAMGLYRTMMFEDKLYKVRMAAGYIADYLSSTIAYLNGTYLNDWTIGNIKLLSQMKEVPEGFIQYQKSMVAAKTTEELKSLSHLMIECVRRFAMAKKPPRQEPERNPDFNNLAGWYEELSLTWRRLSHYCDTQNAEMALTDGCSLQSELMIVGEEFGLKEMNLLDYYDADDLQALKQRSKELEEYIIARIEEQGARIHGYNSLEEFLKAN